MRRGFIIDTFEETNAADWLFSFVCLVIIYKCRNAAVWLPAIVIQHPAGAYAMSEKNIMLGIKDCFDFFVGRTDPIRIIVVQHFGKVNKGFGRSFVSNF